MGAIIFFTSPAPSYQEPRDDEEQDTLKSNEEPKEEKMLSMRTIVTEVPGVLWLALAYACAKGSRYWYFYWCPTWLIEESDNFFNPGQATYLSTALDVGSVIGLIIIGP